MSKKNKAYISEIIYLFVILSCIVGISDALNIIKELLRNINLILIEIFDESILTIFFKYGITFTIVGIILAKLGSPRGKKGHYIGKTLYAIIGYIISKLLNNLPKILLH